jgi:3-deoxy-7-phosphoheptulonate synthase
MLWIGEMTCQVDGAHVAFLKGVLNPIGVKIGPDYDIDNVKNALAPLLRETKKQVYNIVWSCDPMHANTYTSASGHKTLDFNDILMEIIRFFEIHWAEDTIPGRGGHLEMTDKNLTECVGGARNIVSEELHNRYDTTCDPRLNAEQSLEVAFQIADMIKQ